MIPFFQDVEKRLLPPIGQEGAQAQYLLGTDHLGWDIVSRLIYGARISMVTSVSAVVFSAILGTLIGLFSGFYGGKVTVSLCAGGCPIGLPLHSLAIAIIAVLGPDLQNIIIVMGITGWVIYARVVRGEVLSLRGKRIILRFGRWGVEWPDHFQPSFAQRDPPLYRHYHPGDGPDDHHGGGAQLPGPGDSAAHPDLGRDARRWAGVPGDLLVAGDLSRAW